MKNTTRLNVNNDNSPIQVIITSVFKLWRPLYSRNHMTALTKDI